MEDDKNKGKYSLGSWVGLAIGIGVGAAIDNYIIGISINLTKEDSTRR